MTSTEVTQLFPAARTLIWSGAFQEDWRANPHADHWVFSVVWNTGSVQEQPTLHIAAVPSQDRTQVRAWLESGAATEIAAWMDAALTSTDTWRDFGHHESWSWAYDPGENE